MSSDWVMCKAVEKRRASCSIAAKSPLSSDTLVIDCSASGISRKPPVPVWSGNRINVQMIRTCQPTFSAALIGFIEATFADPDAEECAVSAGAKPVVDTDWLRMLAVTTSNCLAWRAHPKHRGMAVEVTAEHLFAAPARVKPEETEKIALLKRLQEASAAGIAKLPQLLVSAGATG